MAVTLCVLLWPREGREAELVAYEDRVLQVLLDHRGCLLQRARTLERVAEPLEVHLLQFPSEDDLDAYMKDDRRIALSGDRDLAVGRTEVFRVDLI
jgi:hypothetical protein